GRVSLYCGFDPTGPSLHAGHLIPLLTLRRFQLAGHRPVVLAGGATGTIGAPREGGARSPSTSVAVAEWGERIGGQRAGVAHREVGERSMNTSVTVAEWAERIGGQLEAFVDINDGPSGARVVNNMQWTGHLSAIEFLRDVGKHFSLNTMLGRDTVKRRLE